MAYFSSWVTAMSLSQSHIEKLSTIWISIWNCKTSLAKGFNQWLGVLLYQITLKTCNNDCPCTNCFDYLLLTIVKFMEKNISFNKFVVSTEK